MPCNVTWNVEDATYAYPCIPINSQTFGYKIKGFAKVATENVTSMDAIDESDS